MNIWGGIVCLLFKLSLSIRSVLSKVTWCFMFTGQQNQSAFWIFKDVCKTDLSQSKPVYKKLSLAVQCKVGQISMLELGTSQFARKLL